MIFKFDLFFREKEKATVPYGMSWLEGMHKWQSRRRFALFPKRLWKYEDKSGIVALSLTTPDDYRLFIKTRYVVWLSHYVEVSAYPRYSSVMARMNEQEVYAVDELDYAFSHL